MFMLNLAGVIWMKTEWFRLMIQFVLQESISHVDKFLLNVNQQF